MSELSSMKVIVRENHSSVNEILVNAAAASEDFKTRFLIHSNEVETRFISLQEGVDRKFKSLKDSVDTRFDCL